jgi:hypothetical protein
MSHNEQPSGKSGIRHFQFAADQYIQAIDAGLRAIKALAVSSPREVEFPVYGVELDGVLALDTQVFSMHWPSPDRRLISKSVRINAYHEFISVNGMWFKISDLCLPPEITAQYMEFSELCVFPQTENELPSYLKYLQAGRGFCRALGRYLRSGAKVWLDYHPPTILNSDAWEVSEQIR